MAILWASGEPPLADVPSDARTISEGCPMASLVLRKGDGVTNCHHCRGCIWLGIGHAACCTYVAGQ